MSTKIVKF